LQISLNFRQSVFEDVIERGLIRYGNFTYDNVYAIKNFQRALAEAAAGKPLRERKNIKDLRPEERDTLKTGLEKAISSGDYARFATFHSQYMFKIHSTGPRLNQRFLPWHRVYLLKFEEMLNTAIKRETNIDDNIAIPYWDWEHDHEIPEFLRGLTPTMNVEVYLYDEMQRPLPSRIFPLTVKRFPGTLKDRLGHVVKLPTEQQINGIRSDTTFVSFADELENGPHGTVHMWVGGVNPNPDPTNPFDVGGEMRNLFVSPVDPCFWCHHANLDRIWAGWQKKLEEEGNISNIYPQLNETDAQMTPWPDITEANTRTIEELGYKYDKL
jgi:tyrosinase